ncbi:modification methylase [Helicobacter sp. Faydin-H64]|uniref:Modification methylase n=1 Tax=Helicobacter turcicus TaxID=2867412 RepID=A0ABS7JKT9_9HELI|nr:modification methylase [Helicobacter turcicus]MBX7544864.1 modification methylase [Helicobacter turcicus]
MKDSKKQEYPAIYKPKYDFLGQSYASMYPNLHKYPATMLPQIGLELLKEFKAKKSNLLDPFCGSGSSFVSGLEYGIKHFVGFDLNPLAITISKARMTYIESSYLIRQKERLLRQLESKNKLSLDFNPLENITNLDFWIDKNAQQDLKLIFSYIKALDDKNLQNLFMLSFSETLREASWTRNNEFKLFRMKDYENYKPNVYAIFTKNLESLVKDYLQFYQSKLQDVGLNLTNASFQNLKQKFDTLLTSPPYGDSKTTVAYGQFSTFINEWLGFKDARKLDSKLMGGIKAQKLYDTGLIKDYVLEISKIDKKRALEISSFYFDLESSIQSLINSINLGGKVFFIVGNRRVKNIELPTDKFIAEVFCNNGFMHLQTIKRKISNKSMPLQNSPTNKAGVLSRTMNEEYIVVCKRLL